MKFVSDMIGNQYLNWKSGDSIFITTPTGSGKSTLILKKLLPHAIRQRKHIVYLCNRKILNDQLLSESHRCLEMILGTAELSEEECQSIHIATYQHCEEANEYPHFVLPSNLLAGMSKEEKARKQLEGQLPEPTKLYSQDILYYVFDEAHYFLADAMFNANTNYWYTKNFSEAISIFLTATPWPLYCFLGSFPSSSIYDQKAIADQISTLCSKRQKLRRNMQVPQKQFRVNLRTDSRAIELKFCTQKEIDQACEKIKPYTSAFDFISSAIKQIQNNPHCYFYTQNADYSYVQPFYFNELHDLIPEIIKSPDKWLIFVESEKEGVELLGRLDGNDCSVVYLSSTIKNKKGSNSQKEFLNIVEHQRFNCRILIATSVLDCGVSIVDQQVKNVVICTADRTEFLQMLGRRRIQNQEMINLYIKVFTPKRINHLRSIYEQNLNFCAKFILLNASSFIKVSEATTYWDGMSERSWLPADEMNNLIKQLPRYSYLVYNKNQPVFAEKGGYVARKRIENDRELLLKEYEVNRSAFVFIMYRLKDCLEAVEIHKSTKDPLFYLKLQLSWVQKQYEESDVYRWVGYEDAQSLFCDFLKGCTAKAEGIPKEKQDNFCKECLEYILKFPVPIETLKNDMSRYKRGQLLPKKNKLNAVLNELKLPYKIISKQSPSGSRKTIWFVVDK